MPKQNDVAERARRYRAERGQWGSHAEALCAEVERQHDELQRVSDTRALADAFNKLSDANAALTEALDNLVGFGAEHELTCDEAEHFDGSCIWCEARKALQKYGDN